MQMNTVRIIAAVVDTFNLTLYKENGDTVTIPQGDTRVRSIVDEAVPLLLKQGYADISIAPAEDNTYVQFEAQTNGTVKLYRIAKSKLLGLMGTDISTLAEEVLPALPMAIGAIPAAPVQGQLSMVSAVEEILQHAVSVNSPDFHEGGLHEQGNVVEDCGSTIKAHSNNDSPDTIVAVVDGQIIPGMEKIKSQFTRAAKLGSTQGVENFLKRLGSVINERKHSVEDLLTFMERGDLPIADDGSILIYKVLQRKEDVFVDCHTKKVEQWIGAYVCMDPSLVDHNRNNECSNGLHVARRGYVKEFSGDVCVLAKLAPEDVIAVPEYDANKMRVCGYHIIAELTNNQYGMVKMNKPMTEAPQGKELLANALAGQHIGKTHEVRITGHKGTGIQVTEMDKATKVKTKEAAPAEALANPSKEGKDEPINPKEVVNQVEQLSRKEQAAKLVEAIEGARTVASEQAAVAALRAFKKASKVSWEKLGVSQEMLDFLDKVEKITASKLVPEVPASPAAQLVQATHAEGSTRERIQKLLAVGSFSPGVAQTILKLKKESKKSWTVLGVSDTEAGAIQMWANSSQ